MKNNIYLKELNLIILVYFINKRLINLIFLKYD